MVEDRIGLSVWVISLKHVKQLRRYGNVHYVSKKMKYVILYCQRDRVDGTVEKLRSLHFVKDVERSLLPFLKTEYDRSSRSAEKERQIGL